ncbi:hypothetical protein R5H30_05390 [Sulfitobacter sp. D35]|uniref:hypothetical protein n=1 Tax=Sulfitobacter sp. D35 TaxID=3083252 RepID=UPI00296F90B2|nr:hypothetical protein [Sulfitobacter sp. D35]MDW4497407.1 hypothetical protein [Sulfitobacter sp. D35]
MRLSALLSLLIALIAGSGAWGQDRTSVHLFRYGSTTAADAEIAFQDFRDMMVAKLPRLASELEALGLNIDAGQLARLALEPVPKPGSDGSEIADPVELIPTLESRRLHWSQTGALALLTGRVKRLDPTELAIRSSFFLGELGRGSGTETVDVELRFSDATYDTTNDSHSVAVLYALALEVLPGCTRKPDVYMLLTQADLRARAVAEEDPSLGAPLTALVAKGVDTANRECPSQ